MQAPWARSDWHAAVHSRSRPCGTVCRPELRESTQHLLLRNICYAKSFFTMEFILMEFYFYG